MFKILISALLIVNFALALPSQDKKVEASGPVCDVCTLVLTSAQNLLEQNKTEVEILGYIEKDVCGRLGSFGQVCNQYVEAYGKVVLEQLIKKINPNVICTKLGLCGAKLDRLPLPEEIREEPKTEKSGTVCQICTVVLSAAQNLLEQNKTEDQVIAFIEKDLCGKLGSLGQICTQYVEAYGKVILYELSQKIDPSLICNHLGLCQTQNVPQHQILKPMTNSLNCTVCKLVFQQVVNLLKNNATEQQILNTIETRLCNATGKFSVACKALIDNYGPTILKYLATGVDPEKLCELIGMCSARKDFSQVVSQQVNPRVDVYCTVCQYAVQFIDYELKNNQTEAAVISTLDKVCKLAPQSLRSQCDNLVNTYGVYLVQLLIQYADPEKVCQAVKLCN